MSNTLSPRIVEITSDVSLQESEGGPDVSFSARSEKTADERDISIGLGCQEVFIVRRVSCSV